VRRANVASASPRHPASDDDAPNAPPARREGPYRSDVPGSSGELALMRVMLLHPALADGVVDAVRRLDEEEGTHPDVEAISGADRGAIRDPVYRALYEAIVHHGAEASPETLAESLDENAIGVMETIRAEPGAVVDGPRTVDGALRMLKERSIQERLGELDRMTPLAAGDEKDALLRAKDALRRELAAIGGRGWKSVRR
jgi:hypothetical protein